MSDHTQGIMKPGVSQFQDREVFTAVPEGNESKIVAVFGFCGAPDEAESIANAKRFCAVWNACEGIATSDLERCRDKPADLTLIAPHAIRQRDELIEAAHAHGKAGREQALNEVLRELDAMYDKADQATPMHKGMRMALSSASDRVRALMQPNP